MANTKRTTKNTGQSVLSQLENLSTSKALCEYVWNALDAGAKTIHINSKPNGLSGLSEISISDDGLGIVYSELDQTFGKFLDSQKKQKFSPITRGRKGKGRFSFVKFAQRALWATFDEKGIEFTIELKASHINEYVVSAPIVMPQIQRGTVVSFSPITIGEDEFINKMVGYIQNDISWLLLADPNIQLYINQVKIKPIDYLSHNYEKESNGYKFDIKTTQWSQRPVKEKSLIYFINSSGVIVHKELSELNGKKFYCSAYVSSSFFDLFDIHTDLLGSHENNTKSEEYRFIVSEVKKILKEEYRVCKSSVADQLIQEYLSQGILPEYPGDNVAYNEFRRNQLIETIKVIYEAEPLLFSKTINIKQKKIFVKLLDRIVETNSLANLFDIFEGIVELNDQEVDKLSNVIKRTSLSNITKTISFINDRLDILEYFQALIKDPEKDTYEVKHIQKSVEDNLWLFGEQYTLLASEEDKFDKALRVFLKEVKGFNEEHFDKYSVDHPDSKKEMDIFAALKGKRYDDAGKEYFHCVVIELKRPSIKLTDKEYEQVKTYKNVISSNSEFTNDNTRWDFILVGNDISDNQNNTANVRDELESNKHHGEYGLLQKSGNKRIYIKTWKQIINEFELRYHDLTDKLRLKELAINQETPDELTSRILEINREGTAA